MLNCHSTPYKFVVYAVQLVDMKTVFAKTDKGCILITI